VTARFGSRTRKYSTAFTFTDTLSLVITSCGGTSMVTVRRSIRTAFSIPGMMSVSPGRAGPPGAEPKYHQTLVLAHDLDGAREQRHQHDDSSESSRHVNLHLALGP
jgi:hypothetical protein